MLGFALANVFVWSGTPFYAGYAGTGEQSAAGRGGELRRLLLRSPAADERR